MKSARVSANLQWKMAYIFDGVTGLEGGKKRTVLMKTTHVIEIMFMGVPQRPSVKGPSMKFTLSL